MKTIYVAETRVRVKMSDDLDCLPADAVRIETRIFPSDADIFRAGLAYQSRGFDVCIDTATIDCYEFGQNELAQTQAIALIPLSHYSPLLKPDYPPAAEDDIWSPRRFGAVFSALVTDSAHHRGS